MSGKRGDVWRLLFADIGEVAVYCPECAEREFDDSRGRYGGGPTGATRQGPPRAATGRRTPASDLRMELLFDLHDDAMLERDPVSPAAEP